MPPTHPKSRESAEGCDSIRADSKTSVDRRLPLLGLLLAAGLAWPAAGLSEDALTPALEARLEGRAGLGDVRLDAFWSGAAGATTARVFGDGVGVWQDETQFELPKAGVLEILELLRKARFGSMPDQFGEDEEGEKDKGPRLRGRLVVRVGAVRKTTVQLVNGDQSKAFARLVEKILRIGEGPARTGVRAASLDDGLRLVAAGRLSPRVLEAAVQRRPDTPGTPGWTLRIEGRDARLERSEAGRPPAADRARTLSEEEFHDLAALLAAAEPSTLPQSLYAGSYTDLTLRLMKYTRTIAGRKFRGMTPETHGERQKAFDRIVAAFDSLHARLETGDTAPAPNATASPSLR